MQVSITQFRRDLFALMNQALEGQDLWIIHKGRRLRVIPEASAHTRLGRVTPLAIIASDVPDGIHTASQDLREEMTRAWERDWATL